MPDDSMRIEVAGENALIVYLGAPCLPSWRIGFGGWISNCVNVW